MKAYKLYLTYHIEQAPVTAATKSIFKNNHKIYI